MAEEFVKNKPWLWRPPKGSNGYIGKRGLRPKEAPGKVTGRAVYTNDIYLPGMLYAKAYRSPYAHARIKSMDSSKAEVLPGVWAVIRYDDPDVDLKDPYISTIRGSTWCWWRDSILPDTADSQGVRLGALVVAESEEICDQALKLIGEGIEWEHLPFILDPEEPAQPGAYLLHPELNPKSNVWKDIVILNQGDVEQGFAASDHVIEFCEYKRDDDVWAGVEPGCMVARWIGDELEFWYHGKIVGMDAPNMSAPAFKSDVNNNKVVKLKVHTPYSGGTFGGNAMGFTAHLVRYAAIAARKTLRPVKVVDDYSMSWEGVSYETGTAHYKVGFNDDGTIVAIQIITYQKSGLPITSKFIESIKTPNVYVREIHSFWSKPHEACWKDGAANCTLVNLIINKVAAHLGMDPIKVQLLNDGIAGHDMAWLDENVKKPNGMPIRDSLKEVIEAGKAAFKWDEKWHAPGFRKLPNGKMHGVGFYAVACWATGMFAGHYPGIYIANDGTATIFFRRCDEGQSAPTCYCQIVADEIGLRYEDVKIEFQEFSCFESMGPGGSMGASINTLGLVLNARELKKLLLEYALKPLSTSPGMGVIPLKPTPSPFEGKTIEELDIKDGIIFEKAHPEITLPVKKLAYLINRNPIMTEAGPFFVAAMPQELPRAKDRARMASLVRQACFVEVEVDTETGQVDVTKLVHSYDVGQSINPDVNEQQLYGGAYEGLGVSSTEAIYYDPQTGVRLNDNLIGYPILTILDVGPIECPIVETHLGWSAYGLCGCSEAGKAATAAALLVPAVYNAIGKWIEDTPVTPDRVLKALGKI
jgi:CO/xanthine dehydrogenase Mo-binding subunit